MTASSLLLAISFLPFFEAKNVAVNNIIDPDQNIEVNENDFKKPELLIRDKCPACKAAGIIVIEEKNFGQFSTYRLERPKKIKQKCPFCMGSRYIEAFYNPTELKILIARDRSKFEADHLAKGEVPVGKAFIPKENHGKIDRKMIKVLKEAYGEPCRTCHWLGIAPCKECDGNGHKPCPNNDCKNGWMVTQTESSYTKTSSGGSLSRGSYNRSGTSRRITRKKTNVNVQICPECSGIGMIKCPECNGRRAQPCRKCNGLGTK